MHCQLLGRFSTTLHVGDLTLSKNFLRAAIIFLILEVTMRDKKQYRILNLNPTWSQSSQETILKREKLALDYNSKLASIPHFSLFVL